MKFTVQALSLVQCSISEKLAYRTDGGLLGVDGERSKMNREATGERVRDFPSEQKCMIDV